MAFFNCGTRKLFYRIDGPADAPWLVLANSIASDHRIWDGLMPALTAQRRVLRFDAMGHGASDLAAPHEPSGLDANAADLLALLDYLEIGQARLAGISMGAMTMMTLALSNPERVETLIYCNAGVSGAPAYAAFWRERIAAVQAGGMAAIADATAARWLTSDADPALREAVLAMIKATPEAGFIAAAEALTGLDLGTELARLTAPVLYVAASGDQAATPDAMRVAAAATPGAGFALITDAAHLSCLEQPDALARLILDGRGASGAQAH